MSSLDTPEQMSEAANEVAPDENSDVLPVGSKFNRYTIVRLIGMGGMGAVYEAVHAELKKRVALKTLHPSYAQNPEIRQRFLREGELASRIHHPNVVDVTDFGTQDNVAYLVMEYLEGQSLEERIEKEGKLDPALATDVLLGACAGVAAANDEGVVHRDLKPANIFLLRQRGGEYRVKIVDFGISKATENQLEGSLTSTGHVVGTPFYMAPEQMRSSREVDHRADQYSLGVTMYEVLCGRKPFEADSLFEVVRKVAQGDFALPRDLVAEIPPGLEAVCLQAMSVNAEHRFKDLREMGRALLPFATDRARILFAPEFGEGAVDVRPAPRSDSPSPANIRQSAEEAGTLVARPSLTGTNPTAKTGETPSITNSTFEVSRPPDGPVDKSKSKVIPAIGVAIVLAIGVAFWAGSVRNSTTHTTDVPRSVSTAQTDHVPAQYAVSITALPNDAWIVVDGQFTVPGEFTRSFPRDGQGHRVVVRSPGYLPQTFEFNAAINRTVQLERDPAAASAPILAGNIVDAGATPAITHSNGTIRNNGRPRNSGSNNGSNGSTQAGTNGAPILN